MIWNKYKKFIIAILLIAVFWGFSIFSIFFLTKKIRGKVDGIQAKIIDQEKVGERIQEIPKFEQQDALIREKESSMPALIKEDDAVDLIEKIENLAESTGNQITIEIDEKNKQANSAPAPKKEKEGENKKTIADQLPAKDYLKLKIRLNGKFNNFIDFAEKLENFPYYSDIISVKIISDSKEYEEAMKPKTATNAQGQTVLVESPQNLEMKIISDIETVYYLEK